MCVRELYSKCTLRYWLSELWLCPIRISYVTLDRDKLQIERKAYPLVTNKVEGHDWSTDTGNLPYLVWQAVEWRQWEEDYVYLGLLPQMMREKVLRCWECCKNEAGGLELNRCAANMFGEDISQGLQHWGINTGAAAKANSDIWIHLHADQGYWTAFLAQKPTWAINLKCQKVAEYTTE